jgi:hypothetical protein
MPVTDVVGVLSGGSGVGVGVGSGVGVGVGVVGVVGLVGVDTTGPDCVSLLSSFPHAASGTIEASITARNTDLIVVRCIANCHSFQEWNPCKRAAMSA